MEFHRKESTQWMLDVVSKKKLLKKNKMVMLTLLLTKIFIITRDELMLALASVASWFTCYWNYPPPDTHTHTYKTYTPVDIMYY